MAVLKDLAFHQIDLTIFHLDESLTSIPLFAVDSDLSSIQTAFLLLSNLNSCLPSSLAGIAVEEMNNSLLLRMIDSMFIRAHAQYKQDYNNALQQDMNALSKQENSSEDLKKSVLEGGTLVAKGVKDVPVIESLFFGAGVIYGLVWNKTLTQERQYIEASKARLAWVVDILKQEQDRIDNALHLAQVKVLNLTEELNQMDELTNISKEIEKEALNKFIRFFKRKSEF